MVTVLFVHGTGVREDDYYKSLKEVEQGLLGLPVTIADCYWGGLGSKLHFNGASIPDYDRFRATDGEPTDEEIQLALWYELYQDPLYELRWLALSVMGEVESVPGRESHGLGLARRVEALTLNPNHESELALIGLEARQFTLARQEVIISEPYQTIINNLVVETTDYREAIARAILATWVKLQLPNSSLIIGQTLRQTLLNDWLEKLGGKNRGIVADYLLNPLKQKALLLATALGQRKRQPIMDYAYPFAGDIVCYQGRHGQTIRDFIVKKIQDAPSPVVILAHSLGGIMAVDVLAKHDFTGHVTKLITVGSQAPLLYEIDGLTNLPLPRNEQNGEIDINLVAPENRLPDHFPTWFNIFDRYDLLSFQAEPVFSSKNEAKINKKVHDYEVKNGEPFMASHSAYWRNTEVWNKVIEVLK